VIYVDAGRLRLRHIGSGRVRELARVPSLDVVASATTPWLAYVAGAGSVAGDFVERPRLHLVDPAGGRKSDLGAGFAPLWHPGGDRVAFLRPVEARKCDAEVCRGASEVVVVDIGSADAEVVLPGGQWVLLSWAGDHLLIADRTDTSATLVVGLSGERAKLDVPPAEVWGASPDGDWLLTAQAGSAAFLPLRDGAASGGGVRVDLPGGVLGEGAWAPDSSHVAAALRSGKRFRLVVFSPELPHPVPIPGASDVVGEVLWSGDSKGLITTQVTRSGSRLRALFCRVRGRVGCRGLFSWVQDVVLLGLR
jgi:hypothetical protein